MIVLPGCVRIASPTHQIFNILISHSASTYFPHPHLLLRVSRSRTRTSFSFACTFACTSSSESIHALSILLLRSCIHPSSRPHLLRLHTQQRVIPTKSPRLTSVCATSAECVECHSSYAPRRPRHSLNPPTRASPCFACDACVRVLFLCPNASLLIIHRQLIAPALAKQDGATYELSQMCNALPLSLAPTSLRVNSRKFSYLFLFSGYVLNPRRPRHWYLTVS